MLLYRFELVRQRVDARDREPEIRIELVGDSERIGLEAEAQKPPVAFVGESGIGYGQGREVGGGERNPAEPLGLLADETCDPGIGPVRTNGFHPHRFVELRPDQDLSFPDGGFGFQRVRQFFGHRYFSPLPALFPVVLLNRRVSGSLPPPVFTHSSTSESLNRSKRPTRWAGNPLVST